MPVTFATYAIGMLALCGFPIFFSGFWSKDAILHAASDWSVSQIPFYLGVIGALLTAFYMTRQVCYAFFGRSRISRGTREAGNAHSGETTPHESPAVMTLPLVILAACSMLLGIIGTPAWPWFSSYLNSQPARLDISGFAETGVLEVMLLSTVVVFVGLGLGRWFYGRKPIDSDAEDSVESLLPQTYKVLRNGFYVDELYGRTVIPFNSWLSRASDWLDRWVWGGAVQLVRYVVLGLSWLNRSVDVFVVNLGFDRGCEGVASGGRILSRLQGGQAQRYLRIVGIAFAVFVLFLIVSRHG